MNCEGRSSNVHDRVEGFTKDASGSNHTTCIWWQSTVKMEGCVGNFVLTRPSVNIPCGRKEEYLEKPTTSSHGENKNTSCNQPTTTVVIIITLYWFSGITGNAWSSYAVLAPNWTRNCWLYSTTKSQKSSRVSHFKPDVHFLRYLAVKVVVLWREWHLKIFTKGVKSSVRKSYHTYFLEMETFLS